MKWRMINGTKYDPKRTISTSLDQQTDQDSIDGLSLAT